MLELIQKIKTYTEAGIILEHMELFDEAENVRCEYCAYYSYMSDYCIKMDLYIDDYWFCKEWKLKKEV